MHENEKKYILNEDYKQGIGKLKIEPKDIEQRLFEKILYYYEQNEIE
jgi:hypothetical protein